MPDPARQPTVRKRQVFYLSGFDPRGAPFYRRLYRDEAAAQARVGGLDLALGPRERDGEFASRWRIATPGDATVTDYAFLHWDDLIRRHWLRNELALIAAYLGVIWLGVRTGALFKVWRVSWPPGVAVTFPFVLLLLVLGLGVAAGMAAGDLAASAFTHAMTGLAAGAPALPADAAATAFGSGSSGGGAWIGGPGARAAGLVAGLAVFAGVVQLGRLLEARLRLYWLLRIYAFSIRLALGRLPGMEERIDAFARLLVERVRASDADEVLIAAHSVGTIVAPMMLARALALDPDLARRGPRISLLTLGQCIPMVSYIPQAARIRADMAALAAAREIDWVDFTAPVDGACFALTDPLATSGIAQPDPAAPRPKLLSPRLPTLFTPATYRRIRRDWYRVHFQYLMASEKPATAPGAYDYFAITAGPQLLAERFAAKAAVRDWKR
ncbi:hypothetical protein [Derxia gummosa]|uniref:Alpha/beta hydrolase n=1 Tax=Derxia gummosa DSM 723 TaxID=1121388 RepID=A0A8B6X8I2_9BURK|nr:hypothetical protein [Derxia gummosa]